MTHNVTKKKLESFHLNNIFNLGQLANIVKKRKAVLKVNGRDNIFLFFITID